MNIDDKLQHAKELIKEKRYQEAKDILLGINHPTAKQWLSKIDSILTNVDDKLQHAKELIKEKRYQEAKDILLGINHPTAKQWLSKIDSILDDPFSYDNPFITQPYQQPQLQMQSYSQQSKLDPQKIFIQSLIFLGFLVVFFLISVVVLALLGPVQGNVFSNIVGAFG